MLYTPEGNPRSEDQTLRRIARRTVRAALYKMDAKTDAVLNALISQISTNPKCKMNAEELFLLVNRHPHLQPERSTINRYMDAFPELKETTLNACQNINRKLLAAFKPSSRPSNMLAVSPTRKGRIASDASLFLIRFITFAAWLCFVSRCNHQSKSHAARFSPANFLSGDRIRAFRNLKTPLLLVYQPFSC